MATEWTPQEHVYSILNDWFPCDCDESYYKRGLISPDCPNHSCEEIAEEIIKRLSSSLSVKALGREDDEDEDGYDTTTPVPPPPDMALIDTVGESVPTQKWEHPYLGAWYPNGEGGVPPIVTAILFGLFLVVSAVLTYVIVSG